MPDAWHSPNLALLTPQLRTPPQTMQGSKTKFWRSMEAHLVQSQGLDETMRPNMQMEKASPPVAHRALCWGVGARPGSASTSRAAP